MTGVRKNMMQDGREGTAARRTTYVLRRNRYLLHEQNNTKQDNCCCTDKKNTKIIGCFTDKTKNKNDTKKRKKILP